MKVGTLRSVLVTEKTEGRMLIDGRLVESETGRWEDSIDPADESVCGRAVVASAADVAQAVDAAERAWPSWFERGHEERGEIVRAFADALMERGDELARIEVRDSGNTLAPTRAAMHEIVTTARYYAGLAHALTGETIPASRDRLHLTVREPYGVVGRIAAYNHPALFSVARTAAALVAGNAVVVKPPETSPLSVLTLGEVARDVLPAGVFNIINGTGAEAGDALVRSPGVKRLALIGSVASGRAIQRSAAEVGVKHVTLELGGKNPAVVFPDVDPDRAAAGVVAGMNFSWQGQSCGSNSRVLIHDDLYDTVLERIVERVAALTVGDPLAEGTDMGPVNSARAHAHVMSFFEPEQTAGARLMTGGRRPPGARFERGYWVEPTVYADVTPEMRLHREEVFGPVMAVSRWSDHEAMIAQANDTEYGLSAAIWTDDITLALRTARRIRAGGVFVNGPNVHVPGVPWGGFKSSGVQREEGREELESYLETKAITINL